jgi:hypothetical protein
MVRGSLHSLGRVRIRWRELVWSIHFVYLVGEIEFSIPLNELSVLYFVVCRYLCMNDWPGRHPAASAGGISIGS